MSQIPSAASRRARRGRVRYQRCPVCAASDVTGLHVDVCEETDRYRRLAAETCAAVGIPPATGDDLWAHLNTRKGPLAATQIVQLVIDLGWRPVVGSDPARLWASPSDAEPGDDS